MILGLILVIEVVEIQPVCQSTTQLEDAPVTGGGRRDRLLVELVAVQDHTVVDFAGASVLSLESDVYVVIVSTVDEIIPFIELVHPVIAVEDECFRLPVVNGHLEEAQEHHYTNDHILVHCAHSVHQ